VLATRRMFDKCLGPVRGVVVSSTYKIYYLPLEALGTSDDAREEQRGGGGCYDFSILFTDYTFLYHVTPSRVRLRSPFLFSVH